MYNICILYNINVTVRLFDIQFHSDFVYKNQRVAHTVGNGEVTMTAGELGDDAGGAGRLALGRVLEPHELAGDRVERHNVAGFVVQDKIAGHGQGGGGGDGVYGVLDGAARRCQNVQATRVLVEHVQALVVGRHAANGGERHVDGVLVLERVPVEGVYEARRRRAVHEVGIGRQRLELQRRVALAHLVQVSPLCAQHLEHILALPVARRQVSGGAADDAADVVRIVADELVVSATHEQLLLLLPHWLRVLRVVVDEERRDVGELGVRLAAPRRRAQEPIASLEEHGECVLAAVAAGGGLLAVCHAEDVVQTLAGARLDRLGRVELVELGKIEGTRHSHRSIAQRAAERLTQAKWQRWRT